MKKRIKILVIKNEPSMWYGSFIGESFIVINNTGLGYYELPNSSKIIFKSDARVLI